MKKHDGIRLAKILLLLLLLVVVVVVVLLLFTNIRLMCCTSLGSKRFRLVS